MTCCISPRCKECTELLNELFEVVVVGFSLSDLHLWWVRGGVLAETLFEDQGLDDVLVFFPWALFFELSESLLDHVLCEFSKQNRVHYRAFPLPFLVLAEGDPVSQRPLDVLDQSKTVRAMIIRRLMIYCIIFRRLFII